MVSDLPRLGKKSGRAARDTAAEGGARRTLDVGVISTSRPGSRGALRLSLCYPRPMLCWMRFDRVAKSTAPAHAGTAVASDTGEFPRRPLHRAAPNCSVSCSADPSEC